MKYIRTENGIKKVFRKLKDGFYLVKVSKYKYCHYCPNYYPNFEVADTIEELFDVVVGIRKSDNRPYLGELKPNYFIEENGSVYKRKDYVVFYGAVWTRLPNGTCRLEPVAKMKDTLSSGEIDWELL